MAEQQVQLTDLNFSQLQEVKRQLDEEVEHLTTSFGQLKQAQAKYRSCVNDIEEVKPTTAGNPLLVPLTSSLYVPGKISDPEHVVIDIGTGYYVKKSRKDAIEYYADKVTYVQKNLEKLQETIERKQDNLQSCVSVMQLKMQEERQAEQAQTA
ncbi:subunit of tubulin prefoldin [Naganishia albida]|nr:subunit of tubulin prefoldin [Naganishia albida]